MGSDNKTRPVRGGSVVPPDGTSVLVGYEEWLDRQALSSASRRAYLRAVRAFVAFVAAGDVRGDPLGDRLAGAHALRDFKRGRLRARAAPATVNLELAAIDTLYRSRGIDPPVVERLELGTLAPRALARREQHGPEAGLTAKFCSDPRQTPIGTADDGLDGARSWMALDWLIRTYVPRMAQRSPDADIRSATGDAAESDRRRGAPDRTDSPGGGSTRFSCRPSPWVAVPSHKVRTCLPGHQEAGAGRENAQASARLAAGGGLAGLCHGGCGSRG